MDIPVRVIIDAIDNASNKVKGVADSMGVLSTQAQYGANALAALGLASVGLGVAVVRQAGEFEQTQQALNVMLGSVEKGTFLFEKLKETAKTTPFEFSQVATGAKQLLAMGSSIETVIPEIRMLGDVASGLNVPLDRLIINFGQVRTQGQLTGRELRDFAMAGVPLYDELAKVLGVNKDAIGDMVSAGKVGFKEVEIAFQNMTGEGGKFHNLMDVQSKTTLGKFSNIKDAISQTSAAMGKALLPAVNQLFDQLIPLIDAFGKFAEANPRLIAGLIEAGIAIGSIGIGLKALKPIMLGVSGIIKLLTLSFSGIASVVGAIVGVLGGPLTIIIAIVVAAITFLALAWRNNWFDIQGKTKAALDWMKGAFENTKTFITNFVAIAVAKFNEFRNSIIDFATAIPGRVRDAFQNMADAVTAKMTQWGMVITATFETVKTAVINFINAAPAAIAKFFLETLPFAIGFTVAAFEKFRDVTLPNLALAIINFFVVTVPTAINTFFMNLTNSLIMAGVEFFNWATITVPNAISLLIAWLGVAIPAMVENIRIWFEDMRNKAIQSVTSLKDSVITNFNAARDNAITAAQDTWKNVVEWFNKTKSDIQTLIDKLPGMIQDAFTKAKDNAVNAAKDLYNGVSEWLGKVKQFFQDIIDKASEAISKAGQAYEAGKKAGARQFGGPVSMSSPVIVGEKGPELFVPSVAGQIIPNNQMGRANSAPTIQFIINADMIINSPTERRNLAEAIYQDLVKIAKSQNTTVAALFGA